MTTTHELAKALLARRNHTLRVEVLVDFDPDADLEPQVTELRDAPGWSWTVPPSDLLHYDSENDVLILRAGVIVTGDEEQD